MKQEEFDNLTDEVKSNIVKQVAIAEAVGIAIGEAISTWPDGLRVDVMQAGIGQALTMTFRLVPDEALRNELLDSFCNVLRATVSEIKQEHFVDLATLAEIGDGSETVN